MRKLDRIHHIALQVKDIKAAICWYNEQFSVHIEYQDNTWALLRFENICVALVTPNQHPPHFAVECPNAENYGELKTHRDGTSSIYLNDPSGNCVEMLKLPD